MSVYYFDWCLYLSKYDNDGLIMKKSNYVTKINPTGIFKRTSRQKKSCFILLGRLYAAQFLSQIKRFTICVYLFLCYQILLYLIYIT